MAATEYLYSISEDFPNQKVNPDSLKIEIISSNITKTFDYIFTRGDSCYIWFDDELSTEEIGILDNIVANHQGDPPPAFEFRASSKILEGPKSITSPDIWEDAGGVVTNISFFVSDPTLAWGRLSGQIKTVGAGAKLRVVRESDGLVCTPADIELPDTEGAWAIVSFWANQNQPGNPDRFILQGYLNGATSLEVRDYAISLLEKTA